jgi:hypothetical protein
MESVESIGVRTVPLSQYLKNYNGSGGGYDGKLLIARHDDYAKKPYPTGFKKMSQFAVDLLGYQYDNLEIIRIMAKIMTSKYSARKGKIKRNNEYICSEYVYECFSAIGIKFKYDKRGFIAPGDIAKDKRVNAVVALKVGKPPKKIKKKTNEPRV